MLGKEGLGNGGQVSQVGLNIYIYIYNEIYIYIYIFISLNKMADNDNVKILMTLVVRTQFITLFSVLSCIFHI